MKKIFRNVLAAVAIASVASCAEKPFNEVETVPNGSQTGSNNLTQMTFTASMKEDVVSKTTFAPATGKVSWENGDTITVFSGAAEGQKFTLTSIAKDGAATFTGLAALSADTFYAVCPHSTANACTSDGTLTVNIPSEQDAVVDNFASGLNVAVATWKKADLSSEEDVIFKNVSTLISFTFANDVDAALTRSITIKVKKNATEYWNIAGDVNVSYTAGGDLEVSEGTEQEVTLNAPAKGFWGGRTYYVSVCPVGEIAGIEITYNYTDGNTTRTKTNNTPDTFTRSNLFALGTLPEAYGDLDLLEVNVDFSNGWPFNEDVAETQSTTGDTYTLKSSNLPIVITTSDTNYPYSYDLSSKYLKMPNADSKGKITIPYVQDRYLCAIVMSTKTYVNYKWTRTSVQKLTDAGKYERICDLYALGYMNWDDRTNFVCPLKEDIPEGGTEGATTYFIEFRDKGTGVKFIKFIYSKTKPVAPTE